MSVFTPTRSINLPNAFKLMTSLRSCGYSFNSAILDLIDNSIDAGATTVQVDLLKSQKVIIADNGKGMDRMLLDEALKLGSNTERSSQALGSYGMGLITSSLALGSKLTVITKTKDGELLQSTQDLQQIKETDKFVKDLDVASLENEALWNHYLGGQDHGTVVLVSNIDKHQVTPGKISKLDESISQTYRKFLQAGTVNIKLPASLGGKFYTVDERDPFEDGKTLLDQDFLFQDIPLHIKVSHIPFSSSSRSIPKQGFYILRNNREVAAGDTLEIYSKHNRFNGFKCELSFQSGNDDDFNVNFMKQKVNILNSELLGFIKEKVDPFRLQIESEERVLLGLNSAKDSLNLKNDQLLQTLVNQFKKELGLVLPRVSSGRGSSASTSKKAKSNETKLTKALGLEVVWTYQSALDNSSFLYNFEYSNNRFEIFINTSHAYYSYIQTMGVQGDFLFKTFIISQLISQFKQSAESEVLNCLNENTASILNLIASKL